MSGGYDSKRASAEAGETVALGKLDTIKTGDTLSSGKTAPPALVSVEPTPPVLSLSLRPPTARTTSNSAKPVRLNEEDPSLTMIQNPVPTTSCCGDRAKCICEWR